METIERDGRRFFLKTVVGAVAGGAVLAARAASAGDPAASAGMSECMPMPESNATPGATPAAMSNSPTPMSMGPTPLPAGAPAEGTSLYPVMGRRVKHPIGSMGQAI